MKRVSNTQAALTVFDPFQKLRIYCSKHSYGFILKNTKKWNVQICKKVNK